MPRTVVRAERRHIKPKSEHESWNFLQDKTKEHRSAVSGSKPALGNTRFHKGFQKRTDGTIKADMRRNFPEVQAHSEAKVLRATRNAATRTRNIARYTRRNGNIITGEGTPAYNPGSRKHFDSEKTEYMVRETRARDVNSMGRFHIPISPRKQTRNAYRQEPRLKIAGRKRSSVLGYGRHDIQSLGVLDNFSSIPIMKAKKVVNEGRELPLFDSN